MAEIKDSPVPSVDRSLQIAALAGAGESSTVRLSKDLSLTVGVETWANEWQTWWPSRSEVARHFDSISAFNVGIIPTATLVYKKFFISGSLMWTPDYDFGTRSDLTAEKDEEGNLASVRSHKINLKSSRQEGDLTVGYFPLDWLGVAIGYKGIVQDYHEDVRSIDLTDQSGVSTSSSSKSYFNGPIFGVMGSARIEERFTLIGNAFGGYLVARCSPSCDEPGNKAEHGSYVASKIVMRYAATPKLSLTLGYRFQVVHTTFDGGAGFTSRTGIDLSHGPVISVNYRF